MNVHLTAAHADLIEAIRAAAFGRRALCQFRPRGVGGILRSGLPVRRRLELADLDGRLVRRGDAFMVIEPPGNAGENFVRTGRARRLNQLDRWFDVLMFASPPSLLLLAALVTAVAVPRTSTSVLVGLGLILGAMSWTATLMTCFVVVHLFQAWRAAEDIGDPARHAVGPMLGRFWSVALCHAPDPEDIPGLLLAAQEQAARLSETHLPQHHRRRGSEVLLLRLDGCTSVTAEHALLAVDDVAPAAGSAGRFAFLGDAQVKDVKRRPNNGPRGITLLLLSLPIVILMSGSFVAGQERERCAEGCPNGGLTTYGQAVTWLFGQLFLQGSSPGLEPALTRTRVLGWLITACAPVLLICVIVAVWRFLKFQESGVVAIEESLEERVRARLPTIGIVTALPVESRAVKALLSQPQTYTAPGDRSPYTLARLPAGPGEHRVVLTRIGTGEGGNDLAAHAVANLVRSFPSVNSVIMCGIAAGVPRPNSPERHVRLGDIVVGTWAVIDFDHVDELSGGPVRRNGLSLPASILKTADADLQEAEHVGSQAWEEWLNVEGRPELSAFARPDESTDHLWAADDSGLVRHPVQRGRRAGHPLVHRGNIGSADRSFRNATVRDEIAARYDLLALEMEGKGIGNAAEMGGVEWLVVRGISDYGDAHQKDLDPGWRNHAALAAAAYVRALIENLPAREPRGGAVKG